MTPPPTEVDGPQQGGFSVWPDATLLQLFCAEIGSII